VRLAVGAAAAVLAAAGAARAEIDVSSRRLTLDHWTAVEFEEGALQLSRTTFTPSIGVGLGRGWSIDLAARAEVADDDVGLGTTDTFSPAARPLIRSPDARIEVDEAVLQWRRRRTSVAIGKQTVAWGALDGLRVTDRFDPVRLRDGVFTEVRPERISRWGVRIRTKSAGLSIDAAAAFDPTADQLAALEDVFAPRAPRSRGGAALGAPTPPIVVEDRDDYLRDASAGLRVGRRIGRASVSLIAISGPTSEPVFLLETASGAPRVRLDYERRALVGATADAAFGPAVLRLEAAFIPDQPANVAGGSLEAVERGRTLVGAGADWDAPFGLFLNAQVAVDHLSDGRAALARPRTDVVGAIRLQRRFRNDAVEARVEYVGVLSDADGAVRPSVSWLATERATIALGADAIFGEPEDLIGQFRGASRGWLRVSLAV